MVVGRSPKTAGVSIYGVQSRISRNAASQIRAPVTDDPAASPHAEDFISRDDIAVDTGGSPARDSAAAVRVAP